VFKNDGNSDVAGAISRNYVLPISRAGSTLSFSYSNHAVKIGRKVTYTAVVSSNPGGPSAPTGAVKFLDRGVPIRGCTSVSLAAAGGSLRARCTVSYPSVATHSISATYAGDANFTGARSRVTAIAVHVDGLMAAPLHWAFAASASYTKIVAFKLKALPAGSKAVVVCTGKGCPYSRRVTVMTHANATVNLAPQFKTSRLKPGATITVSVVRTGWTGRYYAFTIRANKAPKVSSGCLAEGTLKRTRC
jgi:hypothetical protein